MAANLTDGASPGVIAVRAAIDARGWAVVPFLTPDEVEALVDHYRGLGLTAENNYCSIHERSSELKQGIGEQIRSAVEARVTDLDLPDHLVMGGVYIVKGPTQQFVEPHRDPTFVDETVGRSMNMWIPLQAVDRHNGCLWILPNSQHGDDSVRPGNSYEFPSYFDQIPTEEIWDAMVPIEMKAGEALIYDHRLLHGSRANDSGVERISVVVGLIPEGAELFFYHSEEDEPGHYVVSKFRMDPTDYFSFVEFVPESGSLVERVDADPVFLTRTDFQERFSPRPLAPSSVSETATATATATMGQDGKPRLAMGTDSSAVRRLAVDPTLDTRLRTDGYVIVPALHPEQVSDLLEEFQAMEPADGFAPAEHERRAVTYHCTFLDTDVTYKRQANELIRRTFQPHVDRHLHGFRILTSNLYVKPPGRGRFQIHQNWPTQADLAVTTLTLWCPLQPTNRDNGTLHVVPGSHKIVEDVASPLDPPFFSSFEDELVDRFLVPLDLEAGEAAIFDDTLVHWSPVNRSESARWAIQIELVPVETDPVLYVLDSTTNPRSWELYSVDFDFFIEHSIESVIDRPSALPLVGRAVVRNRQITCAEFAELVARGQEIRDCVYSTGSWPSAPSEISGSGHPPKYVQSLLSDFDDPNNGRFLHLGHWDDPASPSGGRTAAQARMNDIMLELAAVEDGMTVLDVGCGVGGTLEVVAARYNEMRLLGVDLDEKALDSCRAVRSRPSNSLSWVQAGATALPVADGSVDAVVSIEAVMHFPSRRAFLSECARVLRPGGRVAIVDVLLMPEAAPSLGLTLPELMARLDPVFGPWPEANATVAETIAVAALFGLEHCETIDATDNTKPTYIDHGDELNRPAADALAQSDAVQLFVGLHLAGDLRIAYHSFERSP